jgi:hypothetical protein
MLEMKEKEEKEVGRFEHLPPRTEADAWTDADKRPSLCKLPNWEGAKISEGSEELRPSTAAHLAPNKPFFFGFPSTAPAWQGCGVVKTGGEIKMNQEAIENSSGDPEKGTR